MSDHLTENLRVLAMTRTPTPPPPKPAIPLTDEKRAIIRAAREGDRPTPLRDIAQTLCVSTGTVRKWAHEMGIDTNVMGAMPRAFDGKPEQLELLRKLWLDPTTTLNGMQGPLGMSRTAIRAEAARQQLGPKPAWVKPPQSMRPGEWPDADVERLRALWTEGLSTAEIGRRMRRSTNAIIGRAHRLKLPSRPSPIRTKPEPSGAAQHIDRIRELAVHNTRAQIARILGLTLPAVEHACTKHGIPPCERMRQRTSSAANRRHPERERSPDIVSMFDNPKQGEGHARVSRAAATSPLPVAGASLKHPCGCQWHMGRDGLTHLFCGEPIGPNGGSWCASHRDIVFVPMSTRRIADAA